MNTVTYYKLGQRWFLDLPEYLLDGGDPEYLERIGAFHDFLEWVADGEATVIFHMDNQPFDGADAFEFTGSSGGNTGGYYRLRSYEGQPVDIELWFNTVIYYKQGELPSRIYFKKVLLPVSSM